MFRGVTVQNCRTLTAGSIPAVGAARVMWQRMMDATDPALLERVERTACAVPDVLDVHDVTLRWLGHHRRGKLHITVDCQPPTFESHCIAEEMRCAPMWC